MDNGDVSVGRGRLQNNIDDCEEEEEDPCHKSGPVTLAQWPRQDGSRLAFGRLKAKLFETRLAAHVRRAQLAITDSIKHAGWAVEHKVSEVSRRGWNEASRAWGSGGAGMGTLTLTGSSGGPHERSSLLLGPGDGYQRLDNNRSNDGWGDDTWTSDWGNNSLPNSPTDTKLNSTETSPNARVSKKNANNAAKKNRGSTKKEGKAEQELLVDVGSSGGGSSKGHTWDNWDDDWEKVDAQ